MNNRGNNLARDLVLVIFSVFIAIILAKTGAFQDLITSTQEVRFIGSFIAGIFFVSVFTAAPATVALGEIAQLNSVITVAILGGLGALIGDLIIFARAGKKEGSWGEGIFVRPSGNFQKSASGFSRKKVRILFRTDSHIHKVSMDRVALKSVLDRGLANLARQPKEFK